LSPGITTTAQASKWVYRNRERIRTEFRKQFTAPTGGLINPRVVGVEHGEIVFRCHYDGYRALDDCWTWYLNPVTMRFHN
jgi:hypothetical protein